MKRLFRRMGMMCRNKLFIFVTGSILLLILMGLVNSGNYFLYRYVDLPTFLLMFLPQLFFLKLTGMGKAFWNGFKIAFSEKEGISRMELQMAVKAISFSGKMAMVTAVIIAMMGGVEVLYGMDSPSTLGPVLAIIALSILYAGILMMLLTPIQVKLESRVVTYMAEPETGESTADAGQTLFYKLRVLGLTDREAEVARQVSCGMSNKEIGQLLYISDSTVKKHVPHILEKTQCGDREALTEKVKGL